MRSIFVFGATALFAVATADVTCGKAISIHHNSITIWLETNKRHRASGLHGERLAWGADSDQHCSDCHERRVHSLLMPTRVQ